MATADSGESPPSEQAFDAAADATHRTQLAGERTFLAWWRTGLTALAVSIAAGRLIPAVAGGPQALYTIDGLLFAGLGVFILIYAGRRARQVNEAASIGRYRPPDDRVLAIVTAGATVGGLILAALVIIGR